MRKFFSFFCKFVGFFTLLGGLAAALLLGFAGSWLPVTDMPLPADYIVVLSGSPARALYAADLFHKEIAPRVLVSKPWRDDIGKRLDALGVDYPKAEKVDTDILLKKGVPAQDIGFFGSANMSTAQEAMELQRIFTDSGASFLIITSPYHVRRTRMIFNDLFPCCEHQVVGTPYDTFAKKWLARPR